MQLRGWRKISRGEASKSITVSTLVCTGPSIDLQVQQGRDEVVLEFPVDDTAGERDDSLVEMSFYIPATNEEFAAEDAEGSAAKVSRPSSCSERQIEQSAHVQIPD